MIIIGCIVVRKTCRLSVLLVEKKSIWKLDLCTEEKQEYSFADGFWFLQVSAKSVISHVLFYYLNAGWLPSFSKMFWQADDLLVGESWSLIPCRAAPASFIRSVYALTHIGPLFFTGSSYSRLQQICPIYRTSSAVFEFNTNSWSWGKRRFVKLFEGVWHCDGGRTRQTPF